MPLLVALLILGTRLWPDSPAGRFGNQSPIFHPGLLYVVGVADLCRLSNCIVSHDSGGSPSLSTISAAGGFK